MPSPVTAVGRLLQPKHGEPRVVDRITRRPDGTFRRVVKPAATAKGDRRR